VAFRLVFFDSFYICQRLNGGRDKWDDILKAVSKLGSIRSGKE